MTRNQQGGPITEPRINDSIDALEVRLVGPGGKEIGIVTIERALQVARGSRLDLVELAPMADPPIAKLMDYQKYNLERDQKVEEIRRKDLDALIKEIKGFEGS